MLKSKLSLRVSIIYTIDPQFSIMEQPRKQTVSDFRMRYLLMGTKI